MNKKDTRIRRSQKTRLRIKSHAVKRMAVFRSNSHIYAQILDETGSKVLAQASTADKELRSSIKHGGNVEAAKTVGKELANRATKLGIKEIAFDRAGFKFHGRVKALAESARENGLAF